MAERGPQRDEGFLVSNGLMEVRLVVSLREARDLWCIHPQGDWEGWLRAGIVRTVETHLPRGIALRVSVDFEHGKRGDGG